MHHASVQKLSSALHVRQQGERRHDTRIETGTPKQLQALLNIRERVTDTFCTRYLAEKLHTRLGISEEDFIKAIRDDDIMIADLDTREALYRLEEEKETAIRFAIHEMIQSGSLKGIAPEDKISLTAFINAADALEGLHRSWRKAILQQPNLSLAVMKEKNIADPYCVLVEHNGLIYQRSWKLLFPEHINTIVSVYNAAVRELSVIKTQKSRLLRAYYSSFVNALLTEYASAEGESMESLSPTQLAWEQFNLWETKILRNDYEGIILLCLRQSYDDHKHTYHASPYVVLSHTAGNTIQHIAEEVRQAACAVMKRELHLETSREFIKSLLNGDLYCGVYLTQTGYRGRKFAGAGLQSGITILMTDEIERRLEKSKAHFFELCDHRSQEVFKRVAWSDVKTAGIVWVIMHELLEPFGNTPLIQERLGSLRNVLNEMLTDTWQLPLLRELQFTYVRTHRKKRLPSHLRTEAYVIAALLFGSVYFGRSYPSETLEPYYLLALQQATVMVDIGILSVTNGGKLRLSLGKELLNKYLYYGDILKYGLVSFHEIVHQGSFHEKHMHSLYRILDYWYQYVQSHKKVTDVMRILTGNDPLFQQWGNIPLHNPQKSLRGILSSLHEL